MPTGATAAEPAPRPARARRVPSEFDERLGTRTAIYVPFPQAVPNIPVIDRANCALFRGRAKGIKKEACAKCRDACSREAIDYDQQDTFLTEEIGAIVVATGYQLYSIGKDQPSGLTGYGEYGYGTIPDVIDGMQFERLASASGPTGGRILRPSDGKEPKRVAFLQCIGSRDPAKGIEYCSKICCMYVAKHTMLYKHKVHDGQATVFYMDIRAAGKGYDEFTRRAIEEDGARYIRGRVSRLYRDGEAIKVQAFDTLSGEPILMDADMVVLATAIRPQPGIRVLAQRLSASYDTHGFFNEAHPKLRPVETNTAGIFLAGACQSPRDIPDSVAMASATAAKVLGMFSKDQMEREPTVARVDVHLCAGCFHCERVCPYGAVTREGDPRSEGKPAQSGGRGQPRHLSGVRDLPGDLPVEERRAPRLHRRPDLRGHQRLGRVERRAMGTTTNETFEPRITAFVCNWCTYTGADLAGTSRLQMSPNARIIRLPCTGRIDPLFIVKAFERGADGVIVSGCHPADCHYTSGNYHARRRFALFRELAAFMGIDPRRITFSWVSASEGGKWRDVVNDAVARVRDLGPFTAYRELGRTRMFGIEAKGVGDSHAGAEGSREEAPR